MAGSQAQGLSFVMAKTFPACKNRVIFVREKTALTGF
jgi:hypothetical protein